ncbi:MAG: iron-containing alcohol dehydrogenase [Desulfurococcaceae archaeon]
MEHNTHLRFSPLQMPAKVIFGIGAVDTLEDELKILNAKKILLVTDKVVGKIDPVSKIIHDIRNEGLSITIYDEIESEPLLEYAEKIADFARKTEPEVVIGIGGGSVLDLAKIASIAITNPGKIRDYIGVNKVKEDGKPLILVPTTAGTGSEVSPASVLIVDSVKESIWSPKLFASTAVVDPSLTVSLPRKLTAVTAMDTLSHAIEAMMSVNSTPLTDSIAKEAIRLVWRFLRIAYKDGQNLKARSGLSLAATLAGIAFSNAGLCAGHAIAYTFASDYKLPHGLSCGIALPYIMAYNLPACMEKFVAIAEIMGKDIEGKDPKVIAHETIIEIINLMKNMEFPTSLKEVGASREKIPIYAEALVTKYKRLLVTNPREISIKDATSIFERMLQGEVI